MSPITVQVARLASRQALRAPLRQQAIRRFTSTKPNNASATAPADWGRIIKSRASTLVIFFPGMALALGWPLAAAKLAGGP
ncbi:hypothetical protein GGS24DRAFT_379295 [Hypoxylon argillaceum]|nr:hypothetical protein GGS24DRAFT_379295 [Hypoxylon argillaceum]KAI1151222.1 hypothetical protein F4825DRAFT_451720 [Nemania diffusa]